MFTQSLRDYGLPIETNAELADGFLKAHELVAAPRALVTAKDYQSDTRTRVQSLRTPSV